MELAFNVDLDFNWPMPSFAPMSGERAEAEERQGQKLGRDVCHSASDERIPVKGKERRGYRHEQLDLRQKAVLIELREGDPTKWTFAKLRKYAYENWHVSPKNATLSKMLQEDVKQRIKLKRSGAQLESQLQQKRERRSPVEELNKLTWSELKHTAADKLYPAMIKRTAKHVASKHGLSLPHNFSFGDSWCSRFKRKYGIQ